MSHLSYLNKFFLKYKLLLICGAFFVIISNIFALYPAEFVRKALDSITLLIKNNTTEKGNMNNILLRYSSLIILFAILKGFFMYCMRQTIIVMSRKIEFDLKNEIYSKYQQLSLSFYKKNKTGDLMNRISEDVSRVRMYIGPALMYTINIISLFYLVIKKMYGISPLLTFYVVSPLPILAISVYIVSRKINLRSERVQEELSQLTTIAQETFSGIKIIKSFKNEKNILNVFIKSCKRYTKKQLTLVKIEACFFPLIVTLIGLSTILTIYIGGLENIKGNISTGNIAEFIIYVNMLAWPVASIGWVTSLVQRASASQQRINEFLLIKPEITTPTNKATKINREITFNKVGFIYSNTKIKALNNISFNLKEDNTLGIIGKTGSGKTTIANLICRLYDATEGKIFFGNTQVRNLNLHQLRSYIGYVPQDGYLFSGTIKENISFGDNNIDEEKIIECLKKVEIIEEINGFHNGINTVIGERGVQLSGGQRQRISIARTLYKNPKILIMDDCLSAIDANKEEKILYNLKKENKYKTKVIISHRISTIKESEHILVLDKGNIIEQGNHKDLVDLKGTYYKIYNNQNNINR